MFARLIALSLLMPSFALAQDAQTAQQKKVKDYLAIRQVHDEFAQLWTTVDRLDMANRLRNIARGIKRDPVRRPSAGRYAKGLLAGMKAIDTYGELHPGVAGWVARFEDKYGSDTRKLMIDFIELRGAVGSDVLPGRVKPHEALTGLKKMLALEPAKIRTASLEQLVPLARLYVSTAGEMVQSANAQAQAQALKELELLEVLARRLDVRDGRVAAIAAEGRQKVAAAAKAQQGEQARALETLLLLDKLAREHADLIALTGADRRMSDVVDPALPVAELRGVVARLEAFAETRGALGKQLDAAMAAWNAKTPQALQNAVQKGLKSGGAMDPDLQLKLDAAAPKYTPNTAIPPLRALVDGIDAFRKRSAANAIDHQVGEILANVGHIDETRLRPPFFAELRERVALFGRIDPSNRKLQQAQQDFDANVARQLKQLRATIPTRTHPGHTEAFQGDAAKLAAVTLKQLQGSRLAQWTGTGQTRYELLAVTIASNWKVLERHPISGAVVVWQLDLAITFTTKALRAQNLAVRYQTTAAANQQGPPLQVDAGPGSRRAYMERFVPLASVPGQQGGAVGTIPIAAK